MKAQAPYYFDFGPRTLVWYDKSLKLWTAVKQDSAGNQVGTAGYGVSRKLALADLDN